MTPILVLGIGNILLRDEGVGVRVIERLAGEPLPPNVEVIDGGTAGADLVDLIANRRRLIVVDAVQAGAAPGAVLRLRPEDLIPDETGLVSLHQVGLLESLDMAARLGCAPEDVRIFGVQPGDLSPGLALSAEVAAAVPRVVALVMEELSNLNREIPNDASIVARGLARTVPSPASR
jgi:hydrogenase maturation protease